MPSYAVTNTIQVQAPPALSEEHALRGHQNHSDTGTPRLIQ